MSYPTIERYRMPNRYAPLVNARVLLRQCEDATADLSELTWTEAYNNGRLAQAATAAEDGIFEYLNAAANFTDDPEAREVLHNRDGIAASTGTRWDPAEITGAINAAAEFGGVVMIRYADEHGNVSTRTLQRLRRVSDGRFYAADADLLANGDEDYTRCFRLDRVSYLVVIL